MSYHTQIITLDNPAVPLNEAQRLIDDLAVAEAPLLSEHAGQTQERQIEQPVVDLDVEQDDEPREADIAAAVIVPSVPKGMRLKDMSARDLDIVVENYAKMLIGAYHAARNFVVAYVTNARYILSETYDRVRASVETKEKEVPVETALEADFMTVTEVAPEFMDTEHQLTPFELEEVYDEHFLYAAEKALAPTPSVRHLAILSDTSGPYTIPIHRRSPVQVRCVNYSALQAVPLSYTRHIESQGHLAQDGTGGASSRSVASCFWKHLRYGPPSIR